MKRSRLLCALICGMMLFCLAIPLGAEAHAESAFATAVVNTGRLNVRSGPGTGYGVVTVIDEKTAVNLYEIKGNWLRIDVPSLNRQGYVNGKYLLVNAPSNPFYGLGYTSGTVNLRSKPDTGGDKRATLASGTGLLLLSVAKNGWFYVRVQGGNKEGYVSNRYVSVICKSAQGSASQGAIISGEGVNLRSGAGMNYKSLAKLKRNTAVTVLAASGDWYQVQIVSSGATGYVYKTYVKSTAATVTPAPNNTANAYINASGVNFRKGASTKYASLGKLSRSTAVTVLGVLGDWYQVQLTGTTRVGFVYRTYVTFTVATPAPQPSPTPITAANGLINASGVNLRSGASTKHTSLGKLTRNTPVSVAGTVGDWYYLTITGTGKSGYVYRKYVTLFLATASFAPSPTSTPFLILPPTSTPTASPTPTPTPTPSPTPSPTPTTAVVSDTPAP